VKCLERTTTETEDLPCRQRTTANCSAKDLCHALFNAHTAKNLCRAPRMMYEKKRLTARARITVGHETLSCADHRGARQRWSPLLCATPKTHNKQMQKGKRKGNPASQVIVRHRRGQDAAAVVHHQRCQVATATTGGRHRRHQVRLLPTPTTNATTRRRARCHHQHTPPPPRSMETNIEEGEGGRGREWGSHL
jgi:hypothetical protein